MSLKEELEIKRIDDYKLWDKMNDLSPNGSIFKSTKYLSGIDDKFHLWGVYHGQEFKAGLVLIVNEKENSCIFNEWVIYSGIIYNFNKNISNFKKNNDEFKIMEFIIKKVSKIYKSFEFNLIYSIKDIRPFLWFNYGNETDDKFTVNIRYTSLLKIDSLLKNKQDDLNSEVFKNFDSSRRQRIKEAIKNGYKIKINKTTNNLFRFYIALMKKNNKALSEKKSKSFEKLLNHILENKLGSVLDLYDNKDNLIYSVMYIWDNKRSYYLFGAGSEENKNSWAGTILNWEAFKYLAKEKSFSEIDLEGINSPNRGSFKVTFGGSVISYFQILK